MSRQLINELNHQLLQQFEKNGQACAETQAEVAARDFTCPERLAQERETLFRQTPQPVAFSAELPEPGSYLALQILDTPVLLTRDDSGSVRAFINSCRHRGARLVEASGSSQRLSCPFHGWTYNLDGTLRGRPGDQFFSAPAEDCALTSNVESNSND